MRARSWNHAFHAEHGNTLIELLLFLVVGMLVLSVSGAASAKEPSAEELEAAATACREDSMRSSPAGTRARLMQPVGRGLSIVMLLLVVGLLSLSVWAAMRSREPSVEELEFAAIACREDSMRSSPAGTRARLMQQVGRLFAAGPQAVRQDTSGRKAAAAEPQVVRWDTAGREAAEDSTNAAGPQVVRHCWPGSGRSFNKHVRRVDKQCRTAGCPSGHC
jgi:hypothetical protein